jgi:hypothetical protein
VHEVELLGKFDRTPNESTYEESILFIPKYPPNARDHRTHFKFIMTIKWTIWNLFVGNTGKYNKIL